MNQLSDLFKILSDQTRLRILVLLYHHDLCVCELTEIMQESQPKISKHIAKIRSLQLVTTNRNEQYVYYSLDRNNELMMNQLSAILPNVLNDSTIKLDLQKLNDMDSFVCARV